MKKIELEMNRAINSATNWGKDNTRVAVWDNLIEVSLYGNVIAKLNRTTQELSISSAGYPTRTTASRLNALVGRNFKVNIKDGSLILSKLDKDFKVSKQRILTTDFALVA